MDIMLDSSPGGVGAQNKTLYEEAGIKAVSKGESNAIADVFFHGYANYEKGLGADYLKLTSCNTTGLIRAVDCLDRTFGLTVAHHHRSSGSGSRRLPSGLTNALQIDTAPSHQAVDLMTIMPHIHATGILVHTPVPTDILLRAGKRQNGRKITKEQAIEVSESIRASDTSPQPRVFGQCLLV